MKKLLFPVLTTVFLLGFLSTRAQKPVLNHIAVYVANLQKSTSFYTEIIGLDTVPEPFHDGKHTWLSLGPLGNLHLIAGASGVTAHDKNSHICFSVPTVDEFIKRLDHSGIAYEDWPGKPKSITHRVDGVKQIYFRDPDGYWIEINDARQ
ncbi:MAG: VOC family protein [Flavisolibacter sp.]